MDRDLSSCALDSSSSDTKSGSDGGNRGSPGAVAGISGFRILDVHDLRVGEDGTNQGPEHIVVVKVEPESPDDSFSQGETGPAEAGCLPDNALRTSNGIQVKEELNEDSLSADEKSTTMFRMFSWTKNVHTITEKSLQQDQKTHCVISKEYEQKCSLDQVYLNTDTCEKTDEGNECNKRFCYSSPPQVHTNTHAMTSLNKCRMCINAFGQNLSQQVHLSIQKGEVEVDTLSTGRTLFHLVNPTSGGYNELEESNTCSVCNNFFTHSSGCHVHRRIHLEEEPLKCSVCNKSFSQNTGRQIHMMKHTEKKPYKCNMCNRTFSDNSTRLVHLRTHTGEKPYKCSLCTRSFSQTSGRQIHMRTHTGEKPYECNVCNRTFSDHSNQRVHIRTHTGEKPFKCTICNKSFTQNSKCQAHMRTHTVGNNKPHNTGLTRRGPTPSWGKQNGWLNKNMPKNDNQSQEMTKGTHNP